MNLEITELTFCVKSVGIIKYFCWNFYQDVHFLIHSLTKKGGF